MYRVTFNLSSGVDVVLDIEMRDIARMVKEHDLDVSYDEDTGLFTDPCLVAMDVIQMELQGSLPDQDYALNAYEGSAYIRRSGDIEAFTVVEVGRA